MAKSLPEYLSWLDDRPDLIWPKPPPPSPVKATPYLKPMASIRAVAWSVYGTLLTISGGRLCHLPSQTFPLQIALEKTIQEFRMWHSMHRKPGAPWEVLLPQYRKLVEERQIAATRRKGDVPEVDSVDVWLRLLERLTKNEYSYDVGFYGSLEELAEKVAYFFHASLQGVAAADGALETLRQVAAAGLRQGLIDDGQCFTVPQLLHALGEQGPRPALSDVLTPSWITLSSRHGVRKPSPSLFAAAVEQFQDAGVEPSRVLYVSQRLKDDLAAARQAGFRTALLVADANCSDATAADVRRADLKPDRLLTDIRQVLQVLRL